MFHGSIVALVTPMHANGDIDFSCIEKLVDWHINNGTNAIVVAGTTGETPTLAFEEHLAVIRRVVDHANNRIPVIAGTGSNCTHKTIEMTRLAMELGADACLLVTPYYNKPTQEGLFQHYQAVAQAVPIPQILYNVPGRTGCEILPATVARLAHHSNIIGIKEGRVESAKEILALCGKNFDVYSGDDITAVEIIKAGGKGVISVAANVAPQAMHDLCQAALTGNDALATQIHERFTPLFHNLFIESNPIPVKWAMQQMGLIPPGIRLPLTPLAANCHSQVKNALIQAGVMSATATA